MKYDRSLIFCVSLQPGLAEGEEAIKQEVTELKEGLSQQVVLTCYFVLPAYRNSRMTIIK